MQATTSPSRTAGRLLLEVLSIVFGVTLALGLQEWREGVKTRRLVDSVLDNVAGEADANRESVRQALAYHRDALIRMQAFADERDPGTVSPMLNDALPNGLVTAFLRSSAWNTAIASNVVPELPYDLVRVLSSGYTLQSRYERLTEGFLQSVYQSMLGSDALTGGSAGSVADALAPAINDMVALEEELSGIYDTLERVLGRDLAVSGNGG